MDVLKEIDWVATIDRLFSINDKIYGSVRRGVNFCVGSGCSDIAHTKLHRGGGHHERQRRMEKFRGGLAMPACIARLSTSHVQAHFRFPQKSRLHCGKYFFVLLQDVKYCNLANTSLLYCDTHNLKAEYVTIARQFALFFFCLGLGSYRRKMLV